jgi:hypothetical protein
VGCVGFSVTEIRNKELPGKLKGYEWISDYFSQF